MSGPRIALLVTHLMGSGHLVRTLTLARALAGLVSGRSPTDRSMESSQRGIN